MRWLQHISFTNSSSSNNHNSSNATPATASASAQPVDCNYSKHRSYLRGAAALGLRFGGGGGNRFTRSRKLRYLSENENDVVSTQQNKHSSNETAPAAVKSVEPVQLPRSPSCSASVASSRLLSSVPVPLPLPLPVHSSDSDSRFPSPREKYKEREKDRDDVSYREKDNGDVLSSSNSPTASVSAFRERRKVEPLDIRSPRKVNPDFTVDNYGDKFRINAPTRSAPSSPFASPVVSPHRTATDLLPYYQMIAKNQVWSAPEMATLDIPGLPPPAFFDITAFSSESSPLHSPPNRSPRWNSKSPTGLGSPLNNKFDTLVQPRESNANIEVHPLPLPPGASRPSMSSPAPQVIAKAECTPLKCQWQKGKLIGRGTFGSVFVASNRETGALCAMKEVDIFQDDPKCVESVKQLEQEIKVLSQLKHPNIVQYYGSEIVEGHFYIYLEYVHPGSINKYVREHCGAITENVVRSFSRHILSGLAYLHSMKTIHRDIKGANLLVDASGVVKLADFGMSKHLSGQAAELSLKGSPYWMAPELMHSVMQKETSSDLALAVDIWSLGCTIIEMFTGKPPWSDYEGAAAMFKVLKDIPPIPETLSPEGKDFLRCCFRRNPADRPSASMLLEHRWLKNSQQLDFPSSTQLINGIKLKDLTHIPNASEVKIDQMPLPPSLQTAKAKGACDSETARLFHRETSNLKEIAGPCYSPRSILEVLPVSSPRGLNINHGKSPSSIPTSTTKSGIRSNHILI